MDEKRKSLSSPPWSSRGRNRFFGGPASVSRSSFYHDYLIKRQQEKSGPRLNSVLEHRLYRDFIRRPRRGADDRTDPSFTYYWTSNDPKHGLNGPTGGIYNLEYNPEGSILAAACEKHNVLLFDPLSRKLIKSIDEAHSDGVNCVRFLDSRTFATCSDDTTVALWDSRFLKKRIRTFKGHSYWVKNIEFSQKDNYLVTSGLDGAICMWDINKYTTDNEDDTNNSAKIFHTNGLMRMCLDSFSNRMVISTMNGYLIIIHDLSLDHIKEDLMSFKPNMYRLLQMSGGPALSGAASSTPLFHSKRNRVEFVSDFPDQNEAEFISSLKLHPQGWVAVSRNVSADENSEWCCVHDIHGVPSSEEDEDEPVVTHQQRQRQLQQEQQNYRNQTSSAMSPSSGRTGLATLADYLSQDHSLNEETSGGREEEEHDDDEDDNEEGEDRSEGVDDETLERGRVTLSSLTNSTVTVDRVQDERGRQTIRIRSEELASARERNQAANQQRLNFARVTHGTVHHTFGTETNIVATRGRDRIDRPAAGGSRQFPLVMVAPSSGIGQWVYFGTPREHRHQQEVLGTRDAKVYRNRPRLTHYLEESNTGRGYIKEVSFTSDGRIFCSPFGYGVRLLAFNEECADLSLQDSQQKKPRLLHEVGTLPMCHEDVVLTSAFSPNSFSLVTGCLAGKIVWHQPLP